MRGMPINGFVRKDNSTESHDLECQEKHSDIISTSLSHERKFSISSCSSDGLLSSKERFVLVYRLKKAFYLVLSSSMTKVRGKTCPFNMISMRDSVEACRLSMKVQLDNIAAYGLMYFHFTWVYSFADVPAVVLDSL